MAVRQLTRVLACIFLAIVVAEGSARVGKFPTGYFEVPNRGNCLQRSRLLGMEFAPNCKGQMSYTDFQTNELGLRDATIRNDGATRILALGDSCTWGWAVAQDEAYPQVLQRLLNGGEDTRYRVINAGRPGYTSYQGLAYLRQFGLAFNPAVVIVGFGYNDAYRPGSIEQEIAWQARWLSVLEVDDVFLNYSRFWRWLRWQTVAANPEPNSHPVGSPERYKENLARIVAVARERGAKPILVSFWNRNMSDMLPYRDVMTGLAAQLDVPVVTYSGPRMDIVHPTRDGYMELATELARALRAEGVL